MEKEINKTPAAIWPLETELDIDRYTKAINEKMKEEFSKGRKIYSQTVNHYDPKNCMKQTGSTHSVLIRSKEGPTQIDGGDL